MGLWDMRFGPLARLPAENEHRSFLGRFRSWGMEYFIGQLFTMYRYIHPIAKYKVHYDRKYFSKAVESLALGYPLYAYLSTNPRIYPLTFPLKIKKPIVIQPIFMWAMAFRCACVTFIPVLTTDPFLRSWWGIDVWHGRGGMYADISIMLWSNMCALFLKFGLSNRLLDYKFMTLYFMVRDGPEWLHPSKFDLQDEDYERYRKYRKWCMQTQVIVTFTAFPTGVIFHLFTYWNQGFFYEKPIPSFLWFFIYFFWFMYICYLLYGNLLGFAVVAMYLCIKKRRYTTRIISMENGTKFRWSTFFDSATKITMLHDELLEYYRVFLWYMSFFFGNMVVIFCNFIYVMFLGRAVPLILRILIAWVTIVHIVIIHSIITRSDDLLKQNKQIVLFILRLVRKKIFYNLHLWSRLKIHHFYYELSRSKIAFRVINGYVLRRATVVLLMVNITTCAMLIFKKQGTREQFGGLITSKKV